jgi:transposase-like protein
MNNTETEPKIRKKRYDPNFKRSAVELWLSGGKSAEAVAAELGIVARRLSANSTFRPRQQIAGNKK